ncbi:MAG: hypothetical protein AAGM38_01110 [Pseudomonadota bacterium]
MADQQTKRDSDEGGSRWWLWLLLLLLLLGGAAFYWLSAAEEEPVTIGDDGRFQLTFEGCDSQGRCGDFQILAPGFGYRWDYGRDSLQAIDGRAPNLRDVINDQLGGAERVIATGLASNEGGEDYNRRLSACRSKRLAFLVDDAQLDLGTRVPTYRLTLGRYEPDPTVVTEDTAIERLVVLGFLRRSDPGLLLDEALKDGLLKALPTALAQALGPIARQLDFTRYSCWDDEFRATPDATVRTACYPEPSQNTEDFCSGF